MENRNEIVGKAFMRRFGNSVVYIKVTGMVGDTPLYEIEVIYVRFGEDDGVIQEVSRCIGEVNCIDCVDGVWYCGTESVSEVSYEEYVHFGSYFFTENPPVRYSDVKL